MLWHVRTDVVTNLSVTTQTTQTLSSSVPLETVPDCVMNHIRQLLGRKVFREWQGQTVAVTFVTSIVPEEHTQSSPSLCEGCAPPSA